VGIVINAREWRRLTEDMGRCETRGMCVKGARQGTGRLQRHCAAASTASVIYSTAHACCTGSARYIVHACHSVLACHIGHAHSAAPSPQFMPSAQCMPVSQCIPITQFLPVTQSMPVHNGRAWFSK